jgi:hypothetical protein
VRAQGDSSVPPSTASFKTVCERTQCVQYKGLPKPIGFFLDGGDYPIGYTDGKNVFDGTQWLSLAQFRLKFGDPLTLSEFLHCATFGLSCSGARCVECVTCFSFLLHILLYGVVAVHCLTGKLMGFRYL